MLFFQITTYFQPEDFKPVNKGLQKLFDYLMSQELQSALFPLKIIFIFLTFFFFFAVIYFITHTEYLDWKISFSLRNLLFAKPGADKKFLKKWKKIKKDLEKAEFEPQWKIAVIESLSLFDKILTKIGYQGDNLLERINNISKEDVSNLQELKEAQEICEDVVRDPDYSLTKDKAKEVISAFEKALKDLEVF
jgi:hypothetical protein